jgi:hypothetical protein
MSAVRPSTKEEREQAVAILRANRAAGRPLFAGLPKSARSESTLREWLARADAVDRMRGIVEEVATKRPWPKPFWDQG